MQKKNLVLAVSAALVITGAFAQDKKKSDPDSVVELYGKVYPEIVSVRSSGASGAGTTTCSICSSAAGENAVIRHNEIESSNSRFGVRGHEKLGGGLRAVWQLETQFLVDQAGTSFAQRDSWMGLKHDRWGTVKLGRFDTPFKEYGDDVSFLAVSSGNFPSTSSVFRHVGFGPQQNAARFHERANNAVQYESPDIGPFDFKVMYSANEGKTATRDPYLWSVGAGAEFGAFKVLVAHEIHKDSFGGSRNVPSSLSNFSNNDAHARDWASAVALIFKWGNHQFGVEANHKEYKEYGALGSGRFRTYEHNAYLVAWDARWSRTWRTAVHYVKATKGKCSRVAVDCNTDGLEGTQLSAGVAYHFTRRTFLFLLAQYVKNDHSARFNSTANDDVNPGEDVTQVAVGLHTSF